MMAKIEGNRYHSRVETAFPQHDGFRSFETRWRATEREIEKDWTSPASWSSFKSVVPIFHAVDRSFVCYIEYKFMELGRSLHMCQRTSIWLLNSHRTLECLVAGQTWVILTQWRPFRISTLIVILTVAVSGYSEFSKKTVKYLFRTDLF